MNKSNNAEEALSRIISIANEALGTTTSEKDNKSTPEEIGCSIKMLPVHLLEKAAETAVKVYPVNKPVLESTRELAMELTANPQKLTLLITKYWGPFPRKLTVSFMESTPADLKKRIIGHMNAWSKTACISFVETEGDGNVRISRGGGGYWSYLGTDILHVPTNMQTMNLQGFTMNTIDSEFYRVIRHETGHTLGFPHEHMRREIINRIDKEKAYEYFERTQGWDRATVDQQVLTPLNDSSIIGTPADQTSIMCYQLPSSITKDNQPILGGTDINESDYKFAAIVYPKLFSSTQVADYGKEAYQEAWTKDQDVSDTQIEEVIKSSLIK
ncbi:peptidase M12 [Niastella yeongjuensis]|uniref:Peptidase M12 n=1 Tax=Niastella yeongjuensis TaxID=354355 RepID=A0A1V9EN89_9BACT|nr:M12 family metallopeptidase [Niastella yeongjuensis]OQP47502.1 peptidase M12 [Niastella yeongjuensis]SEN87018.1 Astacin (Peptidase family M12A) [Niastella yeongjuensis]